LLLPGSVHSTGDNVSHTKITRRTALAGAAAAVVSPFAFAQAFPARPIKVVVPFGPGGTTDTIARLWGQKMGEVLGQAVVVENKPGAAQLLAIRTVLAAPADGYTLLTPGGSAMSQLPALRKDLPYDPLKDFSLIGIAVTNPGVVFVSPALPVKTLAELVAYAKANPGKLNYGSAGVGTAGHLGIEALMASAGVKMTHVPYKSDADVIREVMAGTVQLSVMTTLNTVQAVKAGRIRAIAVTTSNRLPYLPDVQGLSETNIKGIGSLEPHTFISFVGPAGMPPAVLARLNEAMNKVSAMPDVVKTVTETLYAEPATTTPASFREFVEKQLVVWREIGKSVTLTE
jgi:tripartite-type tricarboxylate transporter receptor subunit TctC